MKYIQLSFSLFLFFWVSSSLGVTLNSVSFSELPGGKLEVRGEFSEPPPAPKGYAIEQPARIVFDFEGVESNLEKKKFDLSYGNAKSAVVLSSDGRTRFIINLHSSSAYRTVIEGNALVATIEGSAPLQTFTRQQASEEASQTFSNKESLVINNVDFRRTEEGAGTLLIDLSNSKVIIDIEETANGILVNFFDTDLPDNLRRRFDVVDFGTPVKIIESTTEGSNTLFSIEAIGDYDYLAYQADDQYVITVKPLTEKELILRQEKFKYVGEKLSLNFQDIKVRAVLEIIADVTGLNLVASDTVDGNITLRLDNVPWDQALDLVLKSKGLDKRQTGNVLLVAPAAEIAERERQEIQTRNQLQELAPLRTEFIRIRYAKAADIFSLFKGSDSGGASEATTGILSDRGSAIVDERTNSIILTETAEKIADFKRLVAELDIPIRQVMIEARIVTASDDFRKELGVRWGAISTSNTVNNGQGIIETGGSTDSFADGSPIDFFNGSSSTDLGENMVVDAPTAQAPVGSFAVSYLSNKLLLNLELQALENTGVIEIVSQPKVITGDSQQAKILAGEQIPFTSSDGDDVTTIFRDAVLSLEVTPQITPDNRVIMDLKVNRDSRGTETLNGPAINTTELITNVLVGDGQTIVLGGIYEQEVQEGTSKVPFFGDIPVLGHIFRSKLKINNKEELLIFITPRILSDALIDN